MKSEIVAVLGDVVRLMKMSRGTTSSPLVKLLHHGPSRDAHLKDYGRVNQPAAAAPFLSALQATQWLESGPWIIVVKRA